MTIHAQLRVAYHASGLPYWKIAKMARVSENTVARILHCDKNTTIDTLVAVAKALGVTTITLD